MEDLVLTDDWVVFSKKHESSNSQRYDYEYIYSVKKTTFTNEEAKDFIGGPIEIAGSFPEPTSAQLKSLAISYPNIKEPDAYKTCCICKKNHLYFLRKHSRTEESKNEGWTKIKLEVDDYFCLESMAEVRISTEETYSPDY